MKEIEIKIKDLPKIICGLVLFSIPLTLLFLWEKVIVPIAEIVFLKRTKQRVKNERRI